LIRLTKYTPQTAAMHRKSISCFRRRPQEAVPQMRFEYSNPNPNIGQQLPRR
jgi:hypothetical protein